MQILNKQETFERRAEIISAIKNGKIFVYPTDTIYGLGCDATNETATQKILEIKRREGKTFSVAAPSKDWILTNYIVPDETMLDILPGPYTIIVKEKNRLVSNECVSNGITYIRIPANWFTDFISEAGLPFVTTSVNISGQKNMERIEDLPQEMLEQIDYVIYDGPIVGNQSTRVDLTT